MYIQHLYINACMCTNMHTRVHACVCMYACLRTYIHMYILYILHVTVFWKTDHLNTRTKIQLLPVHDRHTHALSRNTKR